MDFVDINVTVAIAFGLALIAALLTYIAFFKEDKANKRSQKYVR